MRRRKIKKIPILSTQEAQSKFAQTEFYDQVYEGTFHMVEVRFTAKIVRFPEFNERFYRTFKSLFNKVYTEKIANIIEKYHEEYKDQATHQDYAFLQYVTFYCYDELKYHYCDGIFTDGFGAIY